VRIDAIDPFYQHRVEPRAETMRSSRRGRERCFLSSGTSLRCKMLKSEKSTCLVSGKVCVA
jgi:hypothetical protein